MATLEDDGGCSCDVATVAGSGGCGYDVALVVIHCPRSPPFTPVVFGVVIVVNVVVVVPMWCGVVWCGDLHVSRPTQNFFFYLSYFSLPLTHHMTLVEINAFSHQRASLLMPPPTPLANGHHHHYFQHQCQGWRQGVGDVDGRTGGARDVSASRASGKFLFFLAPLTIFFTITVVDKQSPQTRYLGKECI